MKNRQALLKFMCIIMLVLAAMVGTGYYHINDENGFKFSGHKVEAALNGQPLQLNTVLEDSARGTELPSFDAVTMAQPDLGSAKIEVAEAFPINIERNQDVQEQRDGEDGLTESSDNLAAVDTGKVRESASGGSGNAPDLESVHVSSKENSEKSTEEERNEDQPAAAPASAVVSETLVDTKEQEVISSPVSYSWGSSRNYTFRIEVNLVNNGSSTARNVRVDVPLIQDNSPYQTTALRSVNYNQVSTSGRMSSFNLGDIAAGQSKTIIADFDVTLRSVSINSTNDTIEKARQAFNQYAGSGNCRTLARAFISRCREMGIEAREVVGFARPAHGAMTSGCLQGTRHSWAEFYVDGLGWVPADLTFQYFAQLPHTSHIIEGYNDQSIRINFTGGNISANWRNSVL